MRYLTLQTLGFPRPEPGGRSRIVPVRLAFRVLTPGPQNRAPKLGARGVGNDESPVGGVREWTNRTVSKYVNARQMGRQDTTGVVSTRGDSDRRWYLTAPNDTRSKPKLGQKLGQDSRTVPRKPVAALTEWAAPVDDRIPLDISISLPDPRQSVAYLSQPRPPFEGGRSRSLLDSFQMVSTSPLVSMKA